MTALNELESKRSSEHWDAVDQNSQAAAFYGCSIDARIASVSEVNVTFDVVSEVNVTITVNWMIT